MHPAAEHPLNARDNSHDKSAPVLPDTVQRHNFGSHEDDPCNNPSEQFSKSHFVNSPKPDVPESSSEEFCPGTSFAKDVVADTKNKNKRIFREGPIIIELFAGSGRLTAALKSSGVHSAFGVDHKKLSSIAPIMIADLTTRAGQSLFMTWMDAPNLAGIFAAPPCGTCSLARNIKIRGPRGNIISGPVPLRSPQFPEGFPNLANTNLKRVVAANKLYDFLSKVVLKANERDLIFVIENPRSSLFWLTKYFQKIKHLFTFVAHQACAYGSERPKWTALAVNRPAFLQVNMTCPAVDAHHHHKPWGLVSPNKFATAEETAYPPKLAQAIASAFTQALSDDGLKPPTASWDDLQLNPNFAAMRAVAGRQPKASKTPPLVSEYKHTISIVGPFNLLKNPPCASMARIKQPWEVPQGFDNPIPVIPAESQLLRISQTRSKRGG